MKGMWLSSYFYVSLWPQVMWLHVHKFMWIFWHTSSGIMSMGYVPSCPSNDAILMWLFVYKRMWLWILSYFCVFKPMSYVATYPQTCVDALLYLLCYIYVLYSKNKYVTISVFVKWKLIYVAPHFTAFWPRVILLISHTDNCATACNTN